MVELEDAKFCPYNGWIEVTLDHIAAVLVVAFVGRASQIDVQTMTQGVAKRMRNRFTVRWTF